MTWFKDHVFLTAWIALPFTVWSAISKIRAKGGGVIDWTWAIIILTFGITLGITFTPGFDQLSRDFARTLAMFSFMAIFFSRRPT